MSIIKHYYHFLLLVCLFALASTGLTHAMPASGNMLAEPTKTDYFIVNNEVHIEETLFYDPNAGPWLKVLTQDPQSNNTIAQFSLHERIHIAGDHGWTDWHEEILTPGWDWGDIRFDIFDEAGDSILANLIIERMDSMVWFFFDKAPVGSTLEIWKEVICVNPCINPLQPSQFVEIIEYPTIMMEPHTTGLLGLSLMAFGLYRWRMTR